MTKVNPRRNFLRRLSALGSLYLVPRHLGFGSAKTGNMEKKAIRNIEPLGFQWTARDPFLFCVHHEDKYPKGNQQMAPEKELLKGRDLGRDFLLKDGWRMYHGSTVPGFPSHPHRGFETITIVRSGMVDHSDSLGAAGRYGHGDVQWMTAGKGIQHAEMFPLIYDDKENPLELFQVWINLPKAAKFVEPHFKMLWSESIPKLTSKDARGKQTYVEVIAGSIGDNNPPDPPPNSWAANENNDVAIWNIVMEAGARWTLPAAAEGVNRNLYFYKGKELFAGETLIQNYHKAELETNLDIELVSGSEKSYVLILQGRPISEPVVQHGPFVMNTQEEITQTFNDFQKTQFGGWPWPTNDPVHPKEMGRFAKHAGGKEEIK